MRYIGEEDCGGTLLPAPAPVEAEEVVSVFSDGEINLDCHEGKHLTEEELNEGMIGEGLPQISHEARITKLEAELRRTAAILYTAHGGIEVTADGWGLRPTCEMRIGQDFGQRIDECLANVTIEEEKE